MTFRELLEHLSRQIGQHQLPIHPRATELRGLIDSSAVHYELVTQLAAAIYTANHCHRISDPVTMESTFDGIEPIRLAVLRAPGTDVDVVDFVETVCAEVARVMDTSRSESPEPDGSGSGEIVRFRRRLRF